MFFSSEQECYNVVYVIRFYLVCRYAIWSVDLLMVIAKAFAPIIRKASLQPCERHVPPQIKKMAVMPAIRKRDGRFGRLMVGVTPFFFFFFHSTHGLHEKKVTLQHISMLLVLEWLYRNACRYRYHLGIVLFSRRSAFM